MTSEGIQLPEVAVVVQQVARRHEAVDRFAKAMGVLVERRSAQEMGLFAAQTQGDDMAKLRFMQCLLAQVIHERKEE